MAVLTESGERSPVLVPSDEFGDLVKSYRLRAFQFALQIVGNREDAMDLTQEAFLRVHRNWHRRDASRPFGPWLYTIIRNLAIDLLRKRTALREDGREIPDRESPRPGPDVLAQKSQVQEKVWLAINQLAPEQRETLILRDLHGFAYKEIAQITNVPVSTVNSRLHDAREILRRKLRRLL